MRCAPCVAYRQAWWRACHGGPGTRCRGALASGVPCRMTQQRAVMGRPRQTAQLRTTRAMHHSKAQLPWRPTDSAPMAMPGMGNRYLVAGTLVLCCFIAPLASVLMWHLRQQVVVGCYDLPGRRLLDSGIHGASLHRIQVVEKALARGGEAELLQLSRRFRERFVDTLQPRFLPTAWHTDHRWAVLCLSPPSRGGRCPAACLCACTASMWLWREHGGQTDRVMGV